MCFPRVNASPPSNSVVWMIGGSTNSSSASITRLCLLYCFGGVTRTSSSLSPVSFSSPESFSSQALVELQTFAGSVRGGSTNPSSASIRRLCLLYCFGRIMRTASSLSPVSFSSPESFSSQALVELQTFPVSVR